MYKALFLATLALVLNANELKLKDGYIKVHTEVFGDSQINPKTENISSKLYKDEKIETLNGEISINVLEMKSDNEKRDEHMYETLNSKTFPKISYILKKVRKVDDKYETVGVLSFNGKEKELISKASIHSNDKYLVLDGDFSINLTDFGIEPPSMLFVTVRNKIDINYHLNYEKEK